MTAVAQDRQPVRVFFSYSHQDDQHRIRLEKALKLMERQGLIEAWTDRKLLSGDRWEEGIEQELERADLILFLVSDDFIASEFISGKEMTRALEREKAGEARVVPVIVRPSGDWRSAPFGYLQAVPKDGLAITEPEWGTEDRAWADVARRLRAMVEALGTRATGKPGGRAASAGVDVTRYLEYLESKNSYVEIRGMGAQVAEQLPLDKVYTRLRVAGGGMDRSGKEEEDFALRERGLGLPDVLRRSRHAVLVGDPGSGKTTFLRFAAQVLARALLKEEPALAARELGIDAGSVDEVPFPLLVRLSRFAEFLRDKPDGSCPGDAPEHLLRYLEFDLTGRKLLPEGELRRRVERGGCFFLLDGLDEVPGSLRPRVAALVDDLVAASPTDGGNRHLITCRTRAYEGLARVGGLPAYPLAAFEADQVAEFIRGWSRSLYQVRQRRGEGGSEENALTEAQRYESELLGAIRSHQNVGPLTESPLMLTMLAVVHWNQKKLPERRNELYEQAVQYLLESRQEQSANPAPQRKEALQALALAMFLDEEGVQRSLGMAEAGRAVAPVLQAEESEARVFLEEESLRSGLLVSRTEGEVEFWHLSFQEYLAALELATGGEYWAVLGEGGRLHDDRWSEVVLLLAGCLRRINGLRAAKRLIEKILATGVDRVSRARAVGLVARVLVDVLPYGGDPSADTGYRSMLEETLAIFGPPVPGEEVVEERVRIEVGEALGQAGDPRLTWPEENRVRIPGGTFWMGAQKEDSEAPAYDPEALWNESPVRRVTVSPFGIGRYPVTVQEYRRFVEGDGYHDRSLWPSQGWVWRERKRYTAPGSWKDQLRHPNRPVVEISWYEAAAFCRWAGGRLPMEAEWELAARGLAGRKYSWGEQEPDDHRSRFRLRVGQPTPVGAYPAGATPEGVYDLSGNVWEWCGDWLGRYPEESEIDPRGPKAGTSRVLRGGSYLGDASALRAACRFIPLPPEDRFSDIGFRLAWTYQSAAPG